MTRRRWVVLAVVLVLVVLAVVVRRLAGGDGGGSPAALPPAHDPPLTFEASRAVALPRRADADPPPIVLHDYDAVVGLADALQVVDTRSGEVRVTVPALDPAAASGIEGAASTGSASGTGSSSGTGSGSESGTGSGSGSPSPAVPAPGATASVEVSGSQPATPLRVAVGGRPAVAAAFEVSVPGHGTTLGHPAVELLALDLAGYAPVARMRIDLPVTLSGDGVRSVAVVGEDLGVLVVVVRQGSQEVPTTYAVDPVTRRVVWSLPGFAASAVAGHRAVGLLAGGSGGVSAEYGVAGVGAGDGRRAWTAAGSALRSATVWTAGPGLVAVGATDAVTGSRTLSMRDAVTGTVRDTRPAPGGVACRFDERSVTVCSSSESGDAWAAGFDAVTGHLLWQLPDAAAGRVAPAVSTAWHGLVYGRTENGPVALDARTGADRPTSPGAAPALVNGYVGIEAATMQTPHPVAYPATS